MPFRTNIRPATRSRHTARARNLSAARKSTPVRRWLGQHWRTLTGVVAVAIAVSLLWGRIDIDEVHRRAESVPAVAAFALMVVLPMVGCPATLVNLAAGVRFGIAGGLPLVAAAILLHHLIAYGLVRLMPGMFKKLVAPIRRRLPKGSHGSVTIFSALLPGVPYWMQIYSIPMLGVPLRTLLLCSVPFHTARSMIALIGGDISGHLTVGWMVALGAYAVTLMTVCFLVGRHIKRQIAAARPRTRVRSRTQTAGRAEQEIDLDDAALAGGAGK